MAVDGDAIGSGCAEDGEDRLLHVVLVEDQPDDERLLVRAIKLAGIPVRISVAHDGELALALLTDLAQQGEAPDLVISDLKLPKMWGDKLVCALRGRGESLRRLPFVIFSSSSDSKDEERCLNFGASAYIIKPIDYHQFRHVVAEIIRCFLRVHARETQE